MTYSEDWQEIDRQLDELLALDGPARQRRLAELEADDPARAGRLRRLIEAIDRSDSLDDTGTRLVFNEALDALDGPGPGDRIGAWQLVRRAGRGGMAEVFEATRAVGDVEQRAAFKLMSVGLGSEEQRRRFRQETGILARLEDPRLSRLIDAGTAPDGRPWLAMEFIEGEPIDRACDRLGLDVTERVRLMVEVARAVDYCHRALVVHRDLKPANIFLTGDGQVRLLDFGIAKVRDVDGTDAQQTRFQVPAYTLRYSSPEQLMGQVTGVGSDVYQLGLVLYRLLAGCPAFADAEADVVTRLQAMRDGPALPSQAVLADPAGQGDARRRARRLRGDLDSVVMRCLEADPKDRYPGARDLAEDLQRWLDGVPVSARAHTAWYRSARYLRRHWVGATAVAAIFALVVGYAVTVTWQSERLERERNAAELAQSRAESIQAFLLQVFGSVDTQSAESRGKSVEQLLIEGVDKARTEFADQPLLAAQFMTDMGWVLHRRGRVEEARDAFSAALEIRERELGPEHEESLATRTALGEAMYRLGDGPAALQLLQANLEMVERVFPPPSAQVVEALATLGPVESVHGDIERAEAELRRAIDMHTGLNPGLESDPEAAIQLALLRNQLGVVLLRASRWDDAAAELELAVATYSDHAGDLDSRTLEARKNLGFSFRQLRRPEEATAVFEQTLADERALYQGAHWQIAYTLGHLANMASDAEDYERAITLWQEAERETRAAMGDDYYWVNTSRLSQARSMMLAGREEEATAMMREIAALEGRQDNLPEQAKAMLKRFGKEE